MSPVEQRIAIAEACGWTCIYAGDPPMGQLDNRQRWAKALPDYPNDLNAMHEAENCLAEDQEEEFVTRIFFGGAWRQYAIEYCDAFSCMRATAAQRAEAFLKTLNLWEESE